MTTETTEHRQIRLQIEREYGIGLSADRPAQTVQGKYVAELTRDELIAEAQQVKARHNRRAGARALVSKYGRETATRIVANKTGRVIHFQ